MKRRYLLGNDAIAYGLIEGGIEASFAYPGTPSSEITTKLLELSSFYDFYVEWSINEKVAYENAYGVSLTGRRAAAIMKHVGLNVASDALITSAYTGVSGGLVIVVADDPAAHSSQNEQDSRRYAIFSKIPSLEPSSIQEAKEMAIYAFTLSEKIGLPVILRSVTRISHGKSDVLLQENRPLKRGSSFSKNPARFVMIPANARLSLKELNKKQIDIQKELEDNSFDSLEEGIGDTGIIVSGISFQYIREVKEKNNLQIPVYKASSLPLPERKISKFIKDKKKIIVIEEGDPVIEEQIYIISKNINPTAEIIGKIDGNIQREGEFSIEKIERILTGHLPDEDIDDKSPSIPQRIPVLCPGCSHLGSFYILQKVFGKDSIFPGDIGCYTLGIQLGTIDTCLCMGAGISMGSGISRFEENREVVSIIGDSTFFHAGIAGLINACYNKANQIIAILDNRTTAMTGHQPHPGVGITGAGEKTIAIEIERLAYLCGAEEVVVIDPYRINESIERLKGLKGKKGVRVIIAKKACIFLQPATGKTFWVDEKKCTGCKICLQLKCPAISFNGEKADISVYCNGCGICAEVCPFGAITEVEEDG